MYLIDFVTHSHTCARAHIIQVHARGRTAHLNVLESQGGEADVLVGEPRLVHVGLLQQVQLVLQARLLNRVEARGPLHAGGAVAGSLARGHGEGSPDRIEDLAASRTGSLSCRTSCTLRTNSRLKVQGLGKVMLAS